MPQSFQHKKSLGQHFLNSDYVPKLMCDAARLEAGGTVLEIGPGTGILTKELLARGVRVIAVEADARAIAFLEETFPDAIAREELTLHHTDARTLDLQALSLRDQAYKVVSNIPYYLSGSLLRQLLDTTTQPNTLVFLIQKELAERVARSKKESLLSLSVKVFGDPSYIGTIKRGHFTPPPRVDSAILAITNINRNRLGSLSSETFFTILHLGFGSKRKQLLGNLSARWPREALEALFSDLDLPLTIRAEDVPLSTWIPLCTHLSSPAFQQQMHP
ncbi:MAG: 16S rRNA (adenine(1518)-N(6)/adenine(1519)-N(6))-dimethyltransferase RsmA [Patescibacteria group bacterium]